MSEHDDRHEREHEQRLHHFGGRPCLALANTILWRRGERRDLLVDYDALLRFAARLGTLDEGDAQALRALAAEHPAEAERVLERAVEVRETIYRVFERVAAGEEPRPADLAQLNEALGEAMRHVAVAPTPGAYRWSWAGVPVSLEAPLWPFVHSAAETLVVDDRTRLKQCPGPTCGWLFLDETRSRTRRWCEPGECGNRQRARDYYARRRASA